jgi:hypothetical protein
LAVFPPLGKRLGNFSECAGVGTSTIAPGDSKNLGKCVSNGRETIVFRCQRGRASRFGLHHSGHSSMMQNEPEFDPLQHAVKFRQIKPAFAFHLSTHG